MTLKGSDEEMNHRHDRTTRKLALEVEPEDQTELLQSHDKNR